MERRGLWQQISITLENLNLEEEPSKILQLLQQQFNGVSSMRNQIL